MAQTDSEGGGAGTRRYRVYTRTGDKGESSLYNGERRTKDDEFFMALGDVDELNACIGLAREYGAVGSIGIEEQLVEIQSRLLDVGSAIATPRKSSRPEQLERALFSPDFTTQLEQWIDTMDDQLPPLKNFILPSGGLAASQLHVARTVCRRAERHAVTLVREGQLDASVAVYINRLSDYLFVAARFAAMRTAHVEQVYKKSKGLQERSLVPGGDAAASASGSSTGSA